MEENTAPVKKNSAMMWPVIGLVSLLLVGGGVFVMSQNRQATPTPTPVSQTTDTTNSDFDEMEDRAEQNPESPSAGEAAGGTELAESEVRRISVSSQGFDFTPTEIRVKEGETIRLTYTNGGGFHDWVVDEFDARTKQINAGESDTIDFLANKKGTFEFYCSVGNHRQMGMVGKLIVE